MQTIIYQIFSCIFFKKKANIQGKYNWDFKEPIFVGRFGSNEIKAVLYPFLPFFIKAFVRERIFYPFKIVAGFFPISDTSVNQFSKLMLEDMKLLDVLGSWRIEEFFLANHLKNANKVSLISLEPYFQDEPWSMYLKHKNVLVIHPFCHTIERQYYAKRELLFKDKRVLPQFKSLQTIKAVQSYANNNSPFTNWFDALDHMKSQIDELDFDVAIIGCGAYGFPLAAHIKRKGKSAIHLGGATQILFGIKGKRWIENKKFDHIINEHFVFPSEFEKIEGCEKVENGCYW
ncbi:MAG: hypothetical protein KA527_04730 [Cytophagaceae bacterium]|nr:hypothetical protein [Cytophagaceae bacterium]